MNIDIRTLYRYVNWANDCVLDGAEQLSEELLRAPIRPGFHSVFDLVAHMMSAEQIWLQRWQGESPTTRLDPSTIPDLATLRSLWEIQRAELLDFVSNVRDTDRLLDYKTTTGVPYQDILWHLMLHVVNHATEHRSQVALYLAMHGIDVGELDFIRYIRDKNHGE